MGVKIPKAGDPSYGKNAEGKDTRNGKGKKTNVKGGKAKPGKAITVRQK